MDMDIEFLRKLAGLNLEDDPNIVNPFKSKDLPTLADLLKSGAFKNIALLVGAGISVNAGIPDFRSKGGFYESLRVRGYDKPEAVFDISVFRDSPSVFYEIAGELDTSDKIPTQTHYFFKLLQDKGLLLKCFTQNIDSLELKAGLSREKLLQAHGHFESSHCIRCKKAFKGDDVLKHMREKRVFLCDACGNPVKPDVVFFGEQLPEEFNSAPDILRQADLLIIIGTSLAVYPFAGLVSLVPKTVPKIVINKYIENARSFKFSNPKVPDLAFEGDCDEILGNLAELCGWRKELDVLVKNAKYLGALDFGTGSTRFILFDNKGQKLATHNIELTQFFPESNMHEQNPAEYISTAVECIDKALVGVDISLIKAIGITNQRETITAWDKHTGQALYRSIIWDDTRTAGICEEFKKHEETIRAKTGLPVSTYFSATKIVWLIRNVPEVALAISEKRCLFGTVETWVIWNLTENRVHVTDISNASRTMLMNLSGYWDEELLGLFGIPLECLPKIESSAEVYGFLNSSVLKGIPIAGALGDQQGALLGHMCLAPGSAKCTYGTGAFLLMNTGTTPQHSKNGLLTTVFGKFGPEDDIIYALEGAVECAGSAVKWMMNSLELFKSYEELEVIQASVQDTGRVYCVPALSGLFAPYWNNEAHGVLVGLSQHSKKAHVVRAVLEGICFRTAELINAMNEDSGTKINLLSVDGGMTKNQIFMQDQSDIADVQVEIPEEKDITALGAALAAGIGVGVFKNHHELRSIKKKVERKITPGDLSKHEERWNGWKEAIRKCLAA